MGRPVTYVASMLVTSNTTSHAERVCGTCGWQRTYWVNVPIPSTWRSSSAARSSQSLCWFSRVMFLTKMIFMYRLNGGLGLRKNSTVRSHQRIPRQLQLWSTRGTNGLSNWERTVTCSLFLISVWSDVQCSKNAPSAFAIPLSGAAVAQAQVVRAAIPILLGLPFNNNINILELPFPLFRAAISMFKANKSFSKFIVHRETNLINYSRL